MDAPTMMLIKILSDVAMTAMKTIAEIDKMTEDEIEAKTREAERLSDELTDMIRRH